MTCFNGLDEECVHSFTPSIQHDVIVRVSEIPIIKFPKYAHGSVSARDCTLNRDSVTETARLVSESERRNARWNYSKSRENGQSENQTF